MGQHQNVLPFLVELFLSNSDQYIVIDVWLRYWGFSSYGHIVGSFTRSSSQPNHVSLQQRNVLVEFQS